MRLGGSALAIALCSLLLALLMLLLGHVFAGEERMWAPAAAGAIVGPVLTLLVVRYGGGFTELAVGGTLVSALGTLISTIVYYVLIGLQWQAMGYYTVLEYLVMMIRSGVFIVGFIRDFVMGLAALLTVAGALAILVVGE